MIKNIKFNNGKELKVSTSFRTFLEYKRLYDVPLMQDVKISSNMNNGELNDATIIYKILRAGNSAYNKINRLPEINDEDWDNIFNDIDFIDMLTTAQDYMTALMKVDGANNNSKK